MCKYSPRLAFGARGPQLRATEGLSAGVAVHGRLLVHDVGAAAREPRGDLGTLPASHRELRHANGAAAGGVRCM